MATAPHSQRRAPRPDKFAQFGEKGRKTGILPPPVAAADPRFGFEPYFPSSPSEQGDGTTPGPGTGKKGQRTPSTGQSNGTRGNSSAVGASARNGARSIGRSGLSKVVNGRRDDEEDEDEDGDEEDGFEIGGSGGAQQEEEYEDDDDMNLDNGDSNTPSFIRRSNNNSNSANKNRGSAKSKNNDNTSRRISDISLDESSPSIPRVDYSHNDRDDEDDQDLGGGSVGDKQKKGKGRAIVQDEEDDPQPDDQQDDQQDQYDGNYDMGGDDGYDGAGTVGRGYGDDEEEDDQQEQQVEERSSPKGKGKGKAAGNASKAKEPKAKKVVAIAASGRKRRSETEDDGGVRRSQRQKLPPLDYWRNERVIYKRRQSGIAINAIVRIPKPDAEPLSKRHRSNGHRGASRGASRGPVKREEERYEDEEGADDATDPDGIVWSWEGQAETKRRIAFTAKMINPRPTHDNKFMFQKVFTELDYFAGGMLLIPAGAEKPTKPAKDNSYMFYCIEGAVSVTVHRTRFTIGPGATFFVPRGNSYSITATSTRDVKLFFTQGRRVLEDSQGNVRPDVEPVETRRVSNGKGKQREDDPEEEEEEEEDEVEEEEEEEEDGEEEEE